LPQTRETKLFLLRRTMQESDRWATFAAQQAASPKMRTGA
jgi:hypothetical protein